MNAPDVVRSMSRLRGVGTFARILTIMPSLVVVPAFVMTVVRGESDPWVIFVAAFLTVPLTAAAVRSCFIGIWLGADEFVARTWWRTLRIPRKDVVSCVSVRYGGAFTEGWTVSYLRELEIATADFGTYRLSGTIAFYRKSHRQRQAVLDYISG